MHHHRAARISQCIFLCFMALLYVAFMLCDFFDGNYKISSILKFSSIVSCFCYSVSNHLFQRRNKELLIMNAGLFFSVIADIFLLFTDHYFFGVLCFCMVQLLYYTRIQLWNRKVTVGYLIIRVFLTLICLVLLFISKVDIDIVLGITVFYFINFIGNLYLLVQTRNLAAQPQFRLFSLGMCLFFLCDICVGLYNISSYVDVSGTILQQLLTIVGFLMWGFYLPGQVLIALSSREKA